jgi:hypothetical protein
VSRIGQLDSELGHEFRRNTLTPEATFDEEVGRSQISELFQVVGAEEDPGVGGRLGITPRELQDRLAGLCDLALGNALRLRKSVENLDGVLFFGSPSR